jgi:hypothetical protein
LAFWDLENVISGSSGTLHVEQNLANQRQPHIVIRRAEVDQTPPGGHPPESPRGWSASGPQDLSPASDSRIYKPHRPPGKFLNMIISTIRINQFTIYFYLHLVISRRRRAASDPNDEDNERFDLRVRNAPYPIPRGLRSPGTSAPRNSRQHSYSARM